MNKGIKKQLLTIMLFISIVPILIVSTVSLMNAKGTIVSEKQETTNNFIDVAEKSVNDILRQCENTLDYLKELPEIKDGLNVENEVYINKIFEHLQKANDNVEYYVFATKDKKTYTYPADGMTIDTNLTDRDWYNGIIGQGEKAFISEVYNDSETGKPIVTVAKEVVNGGEFVGAISCDISLESISKMFSDFKLGQTGEIIILNKNGLVIASNNNEFIGNDKIQEIIDFSVIKNNHEGTLEFMENGEKREGFYGTVDSVGWKIILTQTREELLKSIKTLISIILGISIIITIIVIIISVKYSGKVVSAIQKIVEIVKNNSEGDFTKEIIIKSNNEFEDLSNDLNNMQGNMVKLITNLQTIAERIKNESHELEGVSKDTYEGVSDITRVVNEFSVGVVEMSERLQNLSYEMNDLGNSIDNINRSSEISKELSQENLNMSNSGVAVIEELLSESKLTIDATSNVQNGVTRILDSAKKNRRY